MLPIYLPRKRLIPTNSHWWNIVPKHKDWYLSEYMEVSRAASTRTSLQPTMKPDMRWLEKEIAHTCVEALTKCVKDGRSSVVFRILDDQQDVFHTYGSIWDVEAGSQLLSHITQAVHSSLTQSTTSQKITPEQGLRIAEQIQVVEFLSLFPITLMLGFFRNLEALEVSTLNRRISRTKWQRKDAPYQLALPPEVLERAETVQHGLLFERRAEGTIISAEWYIRLQISQSLAEAVWTQVQAILRLGRDYYLTLANQWIKENRTLLVAHLLSRGLEFYDKLLYHIPAIQKVTSELETANIHTTLRWPTWNWKDLVKQVYKEQRELAKHFATCIPMLIATSEKQDLPDYFGQAVHTAGDECFYALLNNDGETFQAIFPYYFIGGLSMFESIREKTKDWNVTGALSASSEPLIDLCELSGYVILFSEFHQNPLFGDICKKQWDKYFSQDNAQDIMKFWAYIIESKQDFTLMAHRAILRTQWKMEVDDILRSLPRKSIPFPGRSIVAQHRTVVDHSSPLVQVLGGTGDLYMSFFEGTDIFVDLYLKQRSEASDINFGRDRELTRMIENYRKINTKIAGTQEYTEESADEDFDDLLA